MLLLQVFYASESDQKPGTAIYEIGQGSGDVNEGQGGELVAPHSPLTLVCSNLASYVWLVPIYAPEKKYGASGITLSIQTDIDTDRHDIARGAGGKYRYLSSENDGGWAIRNIALYRSTTEQSSPPSGYSGMCTDLNLNRGGTYLYIVWACDSIP